MTSPVPSGARDRLRILVVAPEFPPAVGGMEVHADQVVRHLARRHDVQVLAPAGATSPPGAQTWITLPALSRRFGPSLWRAWRASARMRPDVILAMNAGYALLGALVRCPVVTRVVGNDFYRAWVGPHLPLRFLFWRLPPEGRFSPGRRFREADQRFRNRVARWGLGYSRTILANSSFTSAALAEAGLRGADVVTIVGGVDEVRFRPRPRAELRPRLGLPPGPILVTVARLTRKKGIDATLEGLAAVLDRFPDLLYLIIGQGEEEGFLRGRVAALRLGDHVRFMGALDHASLPDYLAASDVYVQCSLAARDPLSGSIDVETMGRAVCEAGASGLPAVVSRTGGLPDVVVDGETGLIVPERDPAAIGAALSRLLADSGLRERLGRAAVERARTVFSWDVVGRRTEEALYAAHAARGGGHA